MYYKPNLSPKLNIIPENLNYFKEELLSETIILDYNKPDIESVSEVLVTPEVASYKVISTQVGKSNEGQSLTGYKLVVEIKLTVNVTYVANDCSQSVHGQGFETMKSIFVIIPATIGTIDTCKLVMSEKIQVTPYIEFVKFRELDCRRINSCIMLLVNVTTC
ncbi:MAG: hypothetical protein RSG52_13185 [Terrisporobacter sp.]|uniref:hypothetical protein n=1 Tax=Terrisporobacter sp. TaxID=1965305 RepID=UPI002FCC4324